MKDKERCLTETMIDNTLLLKDLISDGQIRMHEAEVLHRPPAQLPGPSILRGPGGDSFSYRQLFVTFCFATLCYWKVALPS